MNHRKIQNFVVGFLLFGCFAFCILSIVVGSLSSLDKHITKLRVVIVNKPEFYFSGLDQPSFYSFSGEGYKCDFRIADQTLDVLEENNDITERVKKIKFHDTVDVLLQQCETGRLQKRKNVHVIGLLQNGETIIDPQKVFQKDRQGLKTSAFLFSICAMGAAIWLIRKYLRAKGQRATVRLAQAESD